MTIHLPSLLFCINVSAFCFVIPGLIILFKKWKSEANNAHLITFFDIFSVILGNPVKNKATKDYGLPKPGDVMILMDTV